MLELVEFVYSYWASTEVARAKMTAEYFMVKVLIYRYQVERMWMSRRRFKRATVDVEETWWSETTMRTEDGGGGGRNPTLKYALVYERPSSLSSFLGPGSAMSSLRHKVTAIIKLESAGTRFAPSRWPQCQ